MKDLCRKIIVMVLVTALSPVGVNGQPINDAKEVSARILANEKGPRSILIEFLLTAPRPIATATLFYRPVGTAQFRTLRLRRNQRLNYDARTDYYQGIEYFVEIRSEAGGRLQVFSPVAPATLSTEALPTETSPDTSSGIWFAILGGIAAILTAGVIKEKP